MRVIYQVLACCLSLSLKTTIKTMRLLLTISACFLALALQAQVPQGIGYQGVATDPQGLELTNQSISIRASILSGAVNGEVQWQETHSTSTDDFGLFALTIGEGLSSGGGQLAGFADIPWGENNYFLQIEMDATGGNDYILMGVNQMMSVPYALYAENTSITYESIENYLLQDFNFIENITNVLSDSLANSIAVDSVFICNVVTNLNDGGCDSLLIDNPNDTTWVCGDVITYWDYNYSTVMLGEDCWFADNLKTTKFSDGTAIVLKTGNDWANGYPTAQYSKNFANGFNDGFGYGYFYNGPAALSSAGLCPSGWHVSTDEDWAALESHLGMSAIEIEEVNWRGTDEGFKLKYTTQWCSPWGFDGSNNDTGFNGVQSGWMTNGGAPGGQVVETDARFWVVTSSAICTASWHNMSTRWLSSGQGGIRNSVLDCGRGHSIRCVRE